MFVFLIPILAGLGAAMVVADGVLETVLIFIIGILAWLIKVIFLPINILLDTVMPEADGLIDMIQPMFDQVGSVTGWLLNSLMISGAAVSLIVSYYTLKFSVSFLLWSIKILFKWKKVAQ